MVKTCSTVLPTLKNNHHKSVIINLLYKFLYYFIKIPSVLSRPYVQKIKTIEMETLKNKVAVVFAASGEIAGAVARSFAQHGAKVYVTGRNLTAVKALADEIKASGGQAEAGKVDALNETEIGTFLQKVVADNGKLDVVFNGIGSYWLPSLASMGSR
jgi:hypothetical protein